MKESVNVDLLSSKTLYSFKILLFINFCEEIRKEIWVILEYFPTGWELGNLDPCSSSDNN